VGQNSVQFNIDRSRTAVYKGKTFLGRSVIQAHDALKQGRRGSFSVGWHPSVHRLLTDKDRALRPRMLVEVCIDVRKR